MKERGIIFNGDMVRAILSGQKTQTRRVIKVDFDISDTASTRDWANALAVNCYPMPTPEQIQQKAERLHGVIHPVILDDGQMVGIRCPLGKVGDRLYVREAFRVHSRATDVATLVYRASERNSWTEQTRRVPISACSKPASPEKWTPSIHMPRWASRILLEITDVRVERLNDISEADALAEGFTSTAQLTALGDDYTGLYASDRFAETWQSIYGAESWNANPWCWAITFRRVEGD